ncbi:MAG: hypothetical protein U1F41_15140 [Burkholderiales bacterium]
MTTVAEVERDLPVATDGAIAAINHESARGRAWQRFRRDPRAEIAGAIVDAEIQSAQFLGDLDALERMEELATRLVDGSGTSALVLARIASATHRFADARAHLADAQRRGAAAGEIRRQSLSVDQACGANLDAVAHERRGMAKAGRTEELVPLAALLADLGEFTQADRAYRRALDAYDDVSPFPLAWTCFQLGMLWGEQVPEPDLDRAATWYRRALDYLPGYAKARVHLAEIHVRRDSTGEARALLEPVIASGDPEVQWRLADALAAEHRTEAACMHLHFARARYDELLATHLLAFADHAAEFYSGSGNDASRALALARANVANRPTRRAIAQLRAIEVTLGVVQ